MGKKGNWFSAIKKVFAHSSKEKVADVSELHCLDFLSSIHRFLMWLSGGMKSKQFAVFVTNSHRGMYVFHLF